LRDQRSDQLLEPDLASRFFEADSSAADRSTATTRGGKPVSEYPCRRAPAASQIRDEHVVRPGGPMREISDNLASVSAGYPGTEQGSRTLGDPVSRGAKRAADLHGIGEGVSRGPHRQSPLGQQPTVARRRLPGIAVRRGGRAARPLRFGVPRCRSPITSATPQPRRSSLKYC
jgi:hypothetical protein